MRATDNNVDVLPREICKCLVEVEIVAGHEAEAETLHFDDGRLGKFKRIVAVEPRFGDLSGGQVLFKIFSRDLTLSVDRISGVSETVSFVRTRVDKYHRITPNRSLLCGVKNGGVVFFDRNAPLLVRSCEAGNVTGFGQYDQIHAVIALLDQAKLLFKIAVGCRMVGRICGLNDTNLHDRMSLYLSVSDRMASIRRIPSCCPLQRARRED